MNTKIIPLALSLALVSPGLFAAAPAVTNPQSEYEKAVKSYTDAATEELRAIRASVDAQVTDAAEETKARFQKVYAGLQACDELLAKLKKAGQADFDGVKANFEGARSKMVKELDAARKS